MTQTTHRPPRTLTIAGSDSGGGAGIQADLKTFAALGCFGMSAITAITAQNTLGVTGVHAIPADMVAAQIDAVASDIGVDAAKTGMLGTAAIVEAVAAAVDRHGIRQLVVDPVMISTSGATLADDATTQAMVRLLFPRAVLVTPNLPEASCCWAARSPGATKWSRPHATWSRWAARRYCSRVGTWILRMPGWTTCCWAPTAPCACFHISGSTPVTCMAQAARWRRPLPPSWRGAMR